MENDEKNIKPSDSWWNRYVFLLGLSIILIGAGILFYPSQMLDDTIRSKHAFQIAVLTMTLPMILFLLAFQKIPKEAGLSLLGAVIGYAFGAGVGGK